MNFERTLTILAGTVVGAIALLYSFGLERKLPIYASLEIATAVTDEVAVQHGDFDDLQALTDDKATLPFYWAEPSRALENWAEHSRASQLLAASQLPADDKATLSLYWAEPSRALENWAEHSRALELLAASQLPADEKATLPFDWVGSGEAMQTLEYTE
jgi:hypothetical protein